MPDETLDPPPAPGRGGRQFPREDGGARGRQAEVHRTAQLRRQLVGEQLKNWLVNGDFYIGGIMPGTVVWHDWLNQLTRLKI